MTSDNSLDIFILQARSHFRRRPMPPAAPFDRLTDSFQLMYNQITIALQRHVYASLNERFTRCIMSGKASGKDVRYEMFLLHALDRWFHTLVSGFQTEYDKWGGDRVTKVYLKRCHRKAPKLFHLMADAYLHIAYDLPRVIADSAHHLRPSLPPVFTKDDLPIQASLLFQSMAPVFQKCFTEHGMTIRIGGLYGLFSSLIPRGWIRPPGHWVLALRNAAWIHAEILEKSGARRPHIETKMKRAVLSAAREVTRIKSMCMWWWPAPPILTLTPAFVLFAQVPPQIGLSLWEWITLIVYAVASLVLVRVWIRFRELRRFSDHLGRAIFRNMNELMVEETGLLTGESGDLPPTTPTDL
jgi:hypothetical protein